MNNSFTLLFWCNHDCLCAYLVKCNIRDQKWNVNNKSTDCFKTHNARGMYHNATANKNVLYFTFYEIVRIKSAATIVASGDPQIILKIKVYWYLYIYMHLNFYWILKKMTMVLSYLLSNLFFISCFWTNQTLCKYMLHNGRLFLTLCPLFVC